MLCGVTVDVSVCACVFLQLNSRQLSSRQLSSSNSSNNLVSLMVRCWGTGEGDSGVEVSVKGNVEWWQY